MSFGVRMRVSGDYACFTRPEMKVERVSYDVMTPSAARGILECVHWKPAIRWVVDRITVLKPVRFQSIRRNELNSKISGQEAARAATGRGGRLEVFIEEDRQQRVSLVLTDVDYIIDAHFEMTDKAGPDDNPGKHLDIFTRRLAKGQSFQHPVLGCREFSATAFGPVSGDLPAVDASLHGERDLGWMLYDIDHANGRTPCFFRAKLVDGVMAVPPRAEVGLVS